MHNWPTTANPAMASRCHGEARLRQFADRNRSTSHTL
jgi:hypothetical protein